MQCRTCKYPNTIVIDTAHKDASTIIRRRKCPKCDNRFTTQESLKINKNWIEKVSEEKGL